MSIAERLKDLRKARNLTQSQLAKIAGLSVSSIINYENGRRTPSVSAVRALGLALHTSIPDIVGNSEVSCDERELTKNTLEDSAISCAKRMQRLRMVHSVSEVEKRSKDLDVFEKVVLLNFDGVDKVLVFIDELLQDRQYCHENKNFIEYMLAYNMTEEE